MTVNAQASEQSSSLNSTLPFACSAPIPCAIALTLTGFVVGDYGDSRFGSITPLIRTVSAFWQSLICDVKAAIGALGLKIDFV